MMLEEEKVRQRDPRTRFLTELNSKLEYAVVVVGVCCDHVGVARTEGCDEMQTYPAPDREFWMSCTTKLKV